MHIRIKKGLDIPVEGAPQGGIQELVAEGGHYRPKFISLNLAPFQGIRFKLLAKEGDQVKIGQPLVEDKICSGRVFASPAAGVVKEVRRGLKRRIMDMVIEAAEKEDAVDFNPLDPKSAARQEIIDRLKEGGMFAHLRQRPFNVLADPERSPRAIFVKAVESAPFAVPAEMHVAGYENDFRTGLQALSKLTDGFVHLVYCKDSTLRAFTEAEGVEKHTVEGPHPAGTHSVHIHYIDPIKSAEDIVWTATAKDVVMIGHLLNRGCYLTEKIVSIGGPGIVEGKAGFFRARAGFPVEGLIAGRLPKGVQRLISGDVLTGEKVEENDFLGFYDHGFSVVPENKDRQLLSFLRIGSNKFTASGAYLSGHLQNTSRSYNFTTNQHGEKRAFIISSPYDNVMPMHIPVMQLIKAIMSEDFDLAEELGLLEVAGEDFALSAFCCPSKIEMVGIVKNALSDYAAEVS